MSRSTVNVLYTSLFTAGALLCLSILMFLLATLLWKGLGAVSFEFIFTPSRSFGAGGGIIYQIAGSLILVSAAALITLPIAVGTAVFKSEFLKPGRLQRICTILVYGLNGIPSIVFGIFGLIFFVNILNTGISWFAGSAILAIMILPTVVLSSYNSISSIPVIYRESAAALGLDRWQVIVRVVIPQGLHGAVTGLLLGLARAVGETAPIMFVATAFSGVQLPGSPFEPVVALPTHILELSQQALDPVALGNAWGASFVLICLVVFFSLSALYARIRLREVSYR